jgi:hypothetical protein
MEGFVLFILIIIVSQIVGAIKGATRQPPGGPQGPQQQPRIERRPLPGSQLPDQAQQQRTNVDAAADYIPPELWELLTGKPHPSASTGQPGPVAMRSPPQKPESLEADTDEEEEARREISTETEDAERYIRSHTRDVAGEVEAALAEQRAVVEARLPEKTSQVVSLETAPLSTPDRHRAFHARIDQPVVPVPVVASLRGLALGNRAELRRAFVLKEVLGPPKALEEEGSDR